MSNGAPVEAFVALGSNLGDSVQIIRAAVEQLTSFSTAPVRRSSLWRSAPVDCPPGSPDFINAVAAIVPPRDETPESLLAKLRNMEVAFGRRPKTVLNEPRPLDLDLIAFGQQHRSAPELMLPHPRAHLRAFVLVPLAELAPQLILPGHVLSITELAASLSHAMTRVEFRSPGF